MGAHAVLFIVCAAVLLSAIALAAWWFDEERSLKRALKQAPRVTVREAREGALVRLSGRAEMIDDGWLRAPLTGRPCAAYVVLVEEYRKRGKSGSWRTLIREDAALEFELHDETGRARVRPGTPRMALERDAGFRSGLLQDATPELEAFLARHGERSEGWLLNRRLRYREGVLAQGEPVAAYGRACWEDDPSPTAAGGGYRDRPRRLALVPPPGGPMLLSDDPSIG